MNARPAPPLPAAGPPGYDAAQPAITLTRAGRAALDLSSVAAEVLAAWDAPHRDHAAMTAALLTPMNRLRAAHRRVVTP